LTDLLICPVPGGTEPVSVPERAGPAARIASWRGLGSLTKFDNEMSQISVHGVSGMVD
tara:strand:+ start:333 stop:506 length:174 start_codon:yes stop_codon:yes gene_type:complete